MIISSTVICSPSTAECRRVDLCCFTAALLYPSDSLQPHTSISWSAAVPPGCAGDDIHLYRGHCDVLSSEDSQIHPPFKEFYP